MQIGILSDTHNNMKNLHMGLEIFSQRQVETLVHCGDLTGVEVARALNGFRVLCVLGNGDVASGDIRQTLLGQNAENYVGLVYRGEIDGVRIAAAHGHMPGVVDELIHEGKYDFVFTGHSHKRQETLVGFTHLINPGALGGLHREERSICLLDLDSQKVEFLAVPLD